MKIENKNNKAVVTFSNSFNDRGFENNRDSEIIFGIDLGTTNSVISYSRNGIPSEISWKFGEYIVPSCVMWLGDDNWVVGEEAYKARGQKNVLYSMKRLMGSQTLHTVQYEGKMKRVSPEFVASLVLKELAKKAEERVGNGFVKKVVITVPAYFGDLQKKATLKAAELANLQVIRLINEPTAASLAYGLDKFTKNEKIFVFDLGGGTFDVTAFNVSKSEAGALDFFDIEKPANDLNVSVIATGGDARLGGDDIDQELFSIFATKVNETARLKYGKMAYKFHKKCEELERERIILSLEAYKKNPLGVLNLEADIDGNKELIFVSPEDVDSAILAVYRRTEKIVDSVIRDSMLRNIDKVVLVGGSTKSELIRNKISDKFPNSEIYLGLDPDKSVSLGAAILGEPDSNTISLVDVNSIPIGVRLPNDKMDILVRQNQTLPVEVIKEYIPSEDYLETVRLDIYQGTSILCSNNVHLGTLRIPVDVTKVKEEIAINVYFSLDLNGVLKIKARVNKDTFELELKNIGSSTTEEKYTDPKMKVWKRIAKNDEVFAKILEFGNKDEINKYLRKKKENDKIVNTDQIRDRISKVSLNNEVYEGRD